MFRRRRAEDDSVDAAVDQTEDAVQDDELDEELDEDLEELEELEDLEEELEDDEDEDDGPGLRVDGPFDSTEIDDDLDRLDLGALLIRPVEGVEVRVEIDEATSTVQGVTLVANDSVLQVGVFAAPRTEGIWTEVRGEIAKSITGGGGTVDLLDGDLGPELRARVVGQDENGKQVTQPVRFIGVDGPRWFLRGLLSGPAVDNGGLAEPLLVTFKGLVIERGTDPMAPHEPLPLRMPVVTSDEDESDEPARPDLNPFRRGPEITEIR